MASDTFEYSGRAYVRPIGRGICLLDPDPTTGKRFVEQLEDLLDEGVWQITVQARRLHGEEVGTLVFE